MGRTRRAVVLTMVLGWGVGGCTCAPPPTASEEDAGPPKWEPCEIGEVGCCERYHDCRTELDPAPLCDVPTGTCLPRCANDEACRSLTWIDYGCGPGTDCVCASYWCVPAPCLGDGDCAEGRCEAGACTTDPLAYDGCVVDPARAVVTPEGGRTLTVSLLAGDRRLAAAAPARFESGDAARVVVDTGGAVLGGPEPGEAVVTATVGEVRCEARVWNAGAAPEGAVRALVVDGETGAPLPGVTVLAAAGDALVEGVTGEDGAASFELPADAPWGLHVLSDAEAPPGTAGPRAHVSVLGLTARDVLVPVPRAPAPDRAAGAIGEVGPDDVQSWLPVPGGDVFALYGTSRPGSILDADPGHLLGIAQATAVVRQPSSYFPALDLPRGAVAWWNGAGVLEDWRVTGPPGRRALWTFGGLQWGAAVSDRFQLGTDPPPRCASTRWNPGDLVGNVLTLPGAPPQWGLRTGVSLTAVPRIEDWAGDLVPDPQALVPVELLPDRPVRGRATARVPSLPEGARFGLVVAAGRVPGEGLVPVGLMGGWGTSEEAGGLVSAWDEDTGGRLALTYVPAAPGVRGPPRFLALAFDPCDLSRPGRPTLDAVSLVVSHGEAPADGGEVRFPAFTAPDPIVFWEEAGGVPRGLLPLPSGFRRLALTRDDGRRWIVYAADGADWSRPDPAEHRCGDAPCEAWRRDGWAPEDEARLTRVDADVGLDAIFQVGGVPPEEVLDHVRAAVSWVLPHR